MKPQRIGAMFKLMTLLAVFIFQAGSAFAAAPQPSDGWKLIPSEGDYGKLFAPKTVQVVYKSDQGVATRLSAWIRTSFNTTSAKETIENYELSLAPEELAYGTALVELSPQLRTIEYVQEHFYDNNGKEIWSKVYEPRTVKEINSRSFDEDFFVAIVDSYFHHGEAAVQHDEKRWRKLWEKKGADGSVSSAIADTLSMRQSGDNLVFWEWYEMKDAAGNLLEVRFSKKAMNVAQGTQKLIQCEYWNAKDGWKNLRDELDDRYYAIETGSVEENSLKSLRAYKNGYQYWLHRYAVDGSDKLPTKK